MKDIVDVAIGEIGYREQGSNKTKYGVYTGTNGAAWCHSFVSWCAHEAGVSTSIVPKTASVAYGMQWYQKKGQFRYKGKYTPKRGDIVYFKTGRSHVGIVESVSGGQLHTIEGNTSDKVARRSYSLNNATITGYGTPKYTSTKNGSSGSGKKDSKKELQYLQKILSRHEAKAETIKADEAETGKIPAGNVMITVNNGKKKFTVPVEDGAKVVWERDSTPGKFTFTAKVEKGFFIGMGNEVLVTVDSKKFFYGFVFTKEVKKDGMASYTVYDQLRYLKNKDTLIYSKKTADEVIRIIAKRFLLKCGNTGGGNRGNGGRTESHHFRRAEQRRISSGNGTEFADFDRGIVIRYERRNEHADTQQLWAMQHYLKRHTGSQRTGHPVGQHQFAVSLRGADSPHREKWCRQNYIIKSHFGRTTL